MPSHHPCSLTPLPLIFVADSGPPCPGSSSHEINIHSHAESHSTHDGGFVYSSHTTITSESTPLPLPPPPPPPPPPPYPLLSPVYGHHMPPSRQMSTVSSRGPRLALPPPPSIGPPPPPPSYVSSPYTYTRSRSAAPSYASSSSSRTARPDSFYTPSLKTTTTTATGSSRRYSPVPSRGRSRLSQQVLMLCDAPPSSASSQRRSRYSSVQDESTVAPESSVSNQTYNAERAARRDKEARGRASRRSSSHCR